jgi:hypothetical protein
VIFAVLAWDHLLITPWIIGTLALMGIGLGFFASRR